MAAAARRVWAPTLAASSAASCRRHPGGTCPLTVRRVGQQRLFALWCARNQRDALVARCRGEAPGHVVSKERDGGRMAPVGHP
jgi:hypothetical protein